MGAPAGRVKESKSSSRMAHPWMSTSAEPELYNSTYSPSPSPTAPGLIITSLITMGPPRRNAYGAPAWQSTVLEGGVQPAWVLPEFIGVPFTGPLVQLDAIVPAPAGRPVPWSAW